MDICVEGVNCEGGESVSRWCASVERIESNEIGEETKFGANSWRMIAELLQLARDSCSS